jgi:hypothetical protein
MTLARSIAFALGASLVAGCAIDVGESAVEAEAAQKEDAAFSAWSAFVTRNGGKVATGRATVIGIRGVSFERAKHVARTDRVFDDLFVVLGLGRKVVRLPGSTHPWERTAKGVPDADGDGSPDVGMIRPGEYEAIGRGPTRLTGGLPAFDVVVANGSGRIPGFRDVNHDGDFDEAERAASIARGDVLTAVLFHHEGDGAPPAVGCQVFAKDPMQKLVAAVGGASARFHYVLVDGSEIDPSTLPE